MNERLRAQRADIIGSMKDPAQTIANAELSGRLRSDAGTRTRRGVLTRLGRSRSGVTFSTDAELPDMSAESAGDLSKMVAAWGDAARRQGLSEEQARRAIAVSLRNLGLEADQVEALLGSWDSSKNDDEDEGGDEELDEEDDDDSAAALCRVELRGSTPRPSRSRAFAAASLSLGAPSGATPPRKLRLFKFGQIDTTKGTFLFDRKAAASVISTWRDYGNDLCFDYEHKAVDPSARAGDGLAAGWFKLAIEADGLYAVDIRWTARAAQQIASREWRYFSPTFDYDQRTGRILELVNVAITNLPATKNLPALIAASARRRDGGPEAA